MKPVAVAVVLFLVAGVLAAPATKPAKPAQGDGLKNRIDDIDLAGLTVREAVDAIAAKSGQPVTVDWKAMEAAGIAATTKIRGRLMDVTVRQALQYVLSELETNIPLEIELDKTHYNITTQTETKAVATRVYNIGPQLERIGAEQATRLPRNTAPNEIRQAAVDQLVRMIQVHVQPHTWRDAGGTAGTISITGTRMTITNTRGALREAEAYLKELDKPRK